MILRMYSVFDSKAAVYLQPFCCRAEGEAVRMFRTSCLDKSHQFGQFPQDYTLVYVGAYDDNSGVGTFLTAPEAIVDGNSVRKDEEHSSGT